METATAEQTAPASAGRKWSRGNGRAGGSGASADTTRAPANGGPGRDGPREERPRITIGQDWTEIEIVSEPSVVVTFKGYAPVVKARVSTIAEPLPLFIGSKSITDGIEPLRVENGGRFAGLKLRLRKESEDRYARYLVEKAA